jgi:hypothetical protein
MGSFSWGDRGSYLMDSGLAFADRGNGFSYGWDADISGRARDRRNKGVIP